MKNLTTLALLVSLSAATTHPAFAASSVSNPLPSQKMGGEMKGAMGMATSLAFKGAEVNGSTVSIAKKDGRTVLRLSTDFMIPKAPAPHWQIVDGDGNVFLLQRLTVVGEKTHREITLPKYIKSIAKVQIWCSFAEVLLGETDFGHTISTK